MANNISFRPVRGLEANILEKPYADGFVYFATDTKKIYMDANGSNKMPMGGNSGIYYGQMTLEETPDSGQTEFTFLAEEIEGGETNLPNINDLILNIPDGCFYRVVYVDGSGLDAIITAEKLTIAGSGSGDGGSGEDVGKFVLDRLTPAIVTVLSGLPYSIGFFAEAVDASGENTGNGTYELYVNNSRKATGVAVQGDNYVPVGQYLNTGENKIRIAVSMDVGGASLSTKTKNYTVTTTAMNLTWDYDETKVNYTSDNFTIDWRITGNNISKTTTIKIDDIYEKNIAIDSTISTTQSYTLTPEDILDFNLSHGAHTFEMWATANLEGNEVKTESIFKKVMFIDRNNTNPVISFGLFDKNLTQYNTTFIPIIIYDSENTSSNATVNLMADGVLVDSWTNVANQTINTWAYTPLISGIHTLTAQCGPTEVTTTIDVIALDIDNDEIPNYTFKFKASDFASNSAIQSWDGDGKGAIIFSEKFDWVNGGLDTDKDEKGNSRQLFRIKAGSHIEIPYRLFAEGSPKEQGKCFKIIYKADKCRDYDAQVLKCTQLFPESYQELTTIGNVYSFTEIEDILTQEDFNKAKQKYLILYAADHLEAIEFIEGTVYYYCQQVIDFANELDKYGAVYKFESNKYTAVEEYQFDKVNKYYYKIEAGEKGLIMNAQSAHFESQASSLDIPYCEDTYMEFEIDISPWKANNKHYVKAWMDGIPCALTNYASDDAFKYSGCSNIIIGSSDCDVSIYMIKIYERHLEDIEHLQNFIADAMNAEEMIARFKRNDILDDDGRDIDPIKLAKANPNCIVHSYTIPKMTISKNDKVNGCSYEQYDSTGQVVLSAENVQTRVQGTSSAAYVLAAANLDSKFNDGFIDASGKKIEGWSMTENAIPIDYVTTKVNVASCEGGNNAINQEWYNRYQPYKTLVRCKNPNARDTMQFTPGVLFIKDLNKTASNATDAKLNNVFADTEGYIDQPYAKMYAVCNAGNSKKNTHVFHDETNPYECCIEVSDNQAPQQWMTSDEFVAENIDPDDSINPSTGSKYDEYYSFRYPDGREEAKDMHIAAWQQFVTWMAKSNPQPKYDEYKDINSQEDYDALMASFTDSKPITLILNDTGTDYEESEYVSNRNIYYIANQNIHGYTNLPFGTDDNGNIISYRFDPYTFKGYTVYDYWKDNKSSLPGLNFEENLQKDMVQILKGLTISDYATNQDTFKEIAGSINSETAFNEQLAIYEHLYIYDETTGKYTEVFSYIEAGEGKSVAYFYRTTNREAYTTDCYEYRMAKMLSECEDHLVMDSVVFHYLICERHCMIDNIAKNTFWSTEDLQHWNLTKDYDNDTADGNDNNGKMTRSYGSEMLDKVGDSNLYVFNAHQAVWLNFVHGLKAARSRMFSALESSENTGGQGSAWDKDLYLDYFDNWQQAIPERCWIEDYYRKYIRPFEVYNDDMFLPMLEGGTKKHQRRQYETYQDSYMSSEYFGNKCASSMITIRGNGANKLGATLPVEVYADCYIHAAVGSGHTPNFSQRVKRNQKVDIICPRDNLNNTTFYMYPASLYSTVGTEEENLSKFLPEQLSMAAAPKLRELYLATTNSELNKNLTNMGFENNELLETLYVANCPDAKVPLNLSVAPNLKTLDARGSGFTSISIANNAPVETLKLGKPSSLVLKNLTELKTLTLESFDNLVSLNIANIDNSPGVNSKEDLLDKTINGKFKSYNFNDVQWTIDNPDEIIDEEKIASIEKLLAIQPVAPEGKDDPQPLAISLTGDIYITDEAYNGANAFAIQDKYAQKDIYPSLNIDFESTNPELFIVSILDGNNKVCWKRMIAAGGNVDNEFLSQGPNGQFTLSMIAKSDTPANTFKFTNIWDVQSNNISIGSIETEDGALPVYSNVQADITIIPLFDEEIRKYTLSFYGDDITTPFYVKEGCAYGTSLIDHIPNEIPYKDSSNLALEAAWDFNGYAFVQGSTNTVPENYTVSNDANFYAIFTKIDDIRTVVHYDWFNYEDYTYRQDSTYSRYITNPISDVEGYKIVPKVKMKGKITIPAKYNNKPIVAIGGFPEAGQEVTHIFCEAGSQLYEISDNAFSYNNVNYEEKYLQYFDFTQNTVRYIGSFAFQRCVALKAELFNLSKNIFFVGDYAFNGALTSSTPVTIKIPASIVCVSQQGFTYFNNIVEGSTLQVGSEEEFSKLDLTAPSLSSANDLTKFTQNAKYIENSGFIPKFTNITFYSLYYSSGTETLGDSAYTVFNAFKPNQGDINLTVIKKEVV